MRVISRYRVALFFVVERVGDDPRVTPTSWTSLVADETLYLCVCSFVSGGLSSYALRPSIAITTIRQCNHPSAALRSRAGNPLDGKPDLKGGKDSGGDPISPVCFGISEPASPSAFAAVLRSLPSLACPVYDHTHQLYMRVQEDGFCAFPDGNRRPRSEALRSGLGLVPGVNNVRFEIRYRHF